MLERLWGKGTTPALLVGVQASTAPLNVGVCFRRKLEKNVLEDAVIPLLGIYPEDAQSHPKDMCSCMFIAALFVIARTWKQLKCPSNEEWIRKM